jgi:methionyl-tRNA formyltransferase
MKARRLRIVFFGMGGCFLDLPWRTLGRDHDIVGLVVPAGAMLGAPNARGIGASVRGWFSGRMLAVSNRPSIEPPVTMALSRDQQSEASEALAKLDPDLFCIAGFRFLLSPSVLGVPKLGTLNIHPSLLPRHRGPNPFFWVFLNQEEETGVSVHWVDEGEDTGPVLGRARIEVPPGITGDRLVLESARKGAWLLRDVVRAVAAGCPPAPERGEGATTRAPRPNPERDYIDWRSWGVARLHQFLRGVWPAWYVPPALRPLAGSSLWKVGRCVVVRHGEPPGHLVPSGAGFRLFATDGWLSIERDRSAEAIRTVKAAARRHLPRRNQA